MNATDFNKPITAAQLNESMFKKFGTKINFNKYTREELENYRNILRTKIHQAEGSSNFNDLLTNETYQQDKYMVGVLNAKIKEMLGEGVMDKVKSVGKKVASGVNKLVGHGSDEEMIKDLQKKVGVPQTGKKPNKDTKESIMKTTEAKKAKPDFLDMDKDGNKKEPMKKAVRDKKVGESTGKFDKTDTTWTDKSGKKHPAQRVTRKTDQLAGGEEDKPRTASSMKSKKTGKAMEATKAKKDYDGDGEIESNKDEVWGSRAKAAAKAGKPFKEAMTKKCCCEEKGKKACPVHGKKMDESRAIFRRHVAIVNESLIQLLNEDEEGKAKAITAASDMVNDFTTWMQRIGQYQTKSMIELADSIRADFGQAESETFKAAVAPALAATLETLTQQREAVSHAVAVLAGEATEAAAMGMDTGSEFGDEMEPSPEDEMNAPMGDEFGASDAAAGGAMASGRKMRESRQFKKLSEGHMLMSKLSR
jgi:hypothetical protein